MATQIKTSDLFVEILINEGVKWVFGIPGEENLDFTESMRIHQDKIKLVLTRHEQAAGFMAATVGRLTGEPGVALSTLGPGATNFTTSSAFAQLGGFPAFFITGQKPIRDSKQSNFQIVDVVEMMRPITKYTKSIPAGNMLASSVRRAFATSITEKPGPVHIELPEDIAAEVTEKRIFPKIKVRRPVAEGKAVNAAAEILLAAQRPVVIIGAAANRQRAINALRSFVDDTGIYWCSTQMGKGVLDERHWGFLGCTALSAKDYVHGALDMSDVIVMVGHDETEKPPFIMKLGGKRKVIHISFTHAIVDNVYNPTAEIVGDIANAVWQIHQQLREKGKTWDQPVFKRYKELSDSLMQEKYDDPAFPMNIKRVVGDMRRVLPEDGIISLDNGLYKVVIARLFRAYQPNTVLLDNALATMGAGIPNAIACKFLYPNRSVVSISGDGGALMNLPELATCVQYDLNVVHLILNDNAFGMIKWKQENAGFPDWGLDLKNPDFVALADSYGAHGHRVASADEFAPLLKKCLNSKGTHVIEIPFNYEWISAKLKAIPNDVAKVLQQVESEFGHCVVEDCMCDEEHAEKEDTFTEEAVEPKTEVSTSPSLPSPQAKKAKTATKSRKGDLVRKGSLVPFYLGGKPMKPNGDLAVINKYNGEEFCKVALANEADVDKATEIAATVGAKKMRELPAYIRQKILQNVVDQATRRRDEFGYYLAIEAGKPITDARGEADRLIMTFQLAAEEATRIYGEYADLGIQERAKGYTSVTKKFPIGPVSLIAPFNFPLNLAAHKVAPAIAAGCPFVLKPASNTPLGALLIGDILSKDANMPPEGFSVLPCTRDAGNLLTTDPRYKLMSFTGSPGVGFALKKIAGKKPVILELGGNAACIIDDLTVGLTQTVEEVVHGAFYQSGQSCISVQRLFVNETIYDKFTKAFVAKVKSLKAGDPLEEDTFIGPLISEKDAVRVSTWVKEAVAGGGTLLCGGEQFGRVFVSPAVVENAPRDAKLYEDEVFGPAVCIESYSDFKAAVAEVNNSKFGLQAGVYTNNWNRAHYAFEEIEAGGVCINSTPSVRIDSQPYGGVKDSGLGREGIKYAIEDYTELKVMVMKNAGQL